MRILMLGDIYAQTGRTMIQKLVPALRVELGADWVIANGENATGGIGLSVKHRDKILSSGVDLITGGNHFFARADWREMLSGCERVLRPHNLGGNRFPGRGWTVLQAPGKPDLGVLNLAGRIFMEGADNPFSCADQLLQQISPGTPVVVDFHAEATSEKIAMAWHLDGRVSFVAGTHTHVQTADERILPGGTGAITDLGMTGPKDGILGVEREIVLTLFKQGFSERFVCAPGQGTLEGVLITLAANGKTEKIQRIRMLENP